MKVLVLPSWYPNKKQNTGSFFKEQAEFLNENGYDVKVLMAEELHTKSHAYQNTKRWIKGKSNKLETHYLYQDPEAYSFPVIIQKSWNEKKQIKTINKKYLKAFKAIIATGWFPDVIHAQGTYKAGFSAKAISELFKIPYVVIEHSPFKIKAYSKYTQKEIKRVLLQANKIAGVSNYQCERMQEDGVSREMDVVWNLMDEDRFVLNRNEKASKFVITTITRPVKVKDVDTFFEAVANFISRIPDRTKVEVIVIGHAALKDVNANTDYYDEKAASLGISDNCFCVPFLSRNEIKNVLDKTQVFVSTSLDEPYGVAIREAMLCGVPVIATKSGGPEDTIHDKTGILVDKKDVVGISNNIYDIYNGSITFDSEYIRNYVISQSGRKAFLKTMTNFYTISND